MGSMVIFPKNPREALASLEQRLKDPTPPVQTVSVKAQVEAIKIVVDKKLEPIQSRLDTLEIKTLIPLQDGKDGRDGKDGKVGPMGLTGPMGLQGAAGRDGKDGKDGKNGKDGVSVVDAEIAADDHLVLKLSNGNIIDVGEMPSMGGSNSSIHVSGNSYQVTVSATEPTEPQINDLWLDIS